MSTSPTARVLRTEIRLSLIAVEMSSPHSRACKFVSRHRCTTPCCVRRDPQVRAVEQSQFMKDVALAGSALVMFAIFATIGEDLGLVIAAPLFNFR